MKKFTAKHAKHLMVWLHVISSVGWCAMAVVQLVLLGRVLGMDPHDQLVTLETSLLLENEILDPLGISTAYTGLMLSALTPWGYFRHWWVTVKFWLTLVAILLGSIYLGKTLERVVEASKAGESWSVTPMFIGTGWTLATLALMVWISIEKPWGRRHAGEERAKRAAVRRAEWSPDAWVFLVALAVPIVEYLARVDYPLLTLGAAIGFALYRGRRLRAARRGPAPVRGDRVVAKSE